MKRILFFSLLSIIMAGCGQSEGDLYNSDTFKVFNDHVEQGDYVAQVIDPNHIISDYQSPANANYSRLIEFKFSLNKKDNELPAGINHRLVLNPVEGKVTSPVITFGTPDAAEPGDPGDSFLEPNTEFTLRLDMSPVLEAFAKDGIYTAFDGSRIAESDFKGVFVAGNASPLIWNFEDLGRLPEFQLTDEDGDGIFETTITMNAFNPDLFTSQEWKLQNDITSYPQLSTGIPLVDALYNLSLDETVMNKEADGTFRTGAKWPGVWTRDVSYSIVLAYAMIDPEYSKNSLRRKVKRGRIIQDTGSGGAWPVSTDRTTWALAAWEVYKATGDQAWLKEAYKIIKATAADDLETIVDQKTGLFRGESSFLDWRKQTYPLWMDNVDIYASLTLGTNAVHYQTYYILSQMSGILGYAEEFESYQKIADSIKDAINDKLWMEDKGYYAQFLYGRHFMALSPRSETLGEALTVLFDIAPEDRQAQVVSNTPMIPFGAPCIYPQIPDIPPYHNNGVWPFVQAYWNIAAAKTGNSKVLEHGLGSMYRAAALFLTNKENFVGENGDYRDTQVNSNRQLWSVAGNLAMTYKVLFGMNMLTESLEFSPAIPKAYDGTKVLTNFPYHNALLDITIEGYGNQIAEMKIDGEVTEKYRFASYKKGKHTIEIKMANNDFGGEINLVENRFSPAAPVDIDKYEKADSLFALTNASDRKLGDGWVIYPPLSSQIEWPVQGSYLVVKDGYESFMSEPFWLIEKSKMDEELEESPTDDSVNIVSYLSPIIKEVETRGNRSDEKLIDYTGSGFIELTKTINRNIGFSVNIERKGTFLVDFRYSNGSGPFNTDNKCAIRTLFVNGDKADVVVMPQRGKDEWSNWGYSNLIEVELPAGNNRFRLSFEEYNENMNVEVNRAMLDHMRLIRIK